MITLPRALKFKVHRIGTGGASIRLALAWLGLQASIGCAPEAAPCIRSSGELDTRYSTCETALVLERVNDPMTDLTELSTIGLDQSTADALGQYRLGPDGRSGTWDDGHFDTLSELCTNSCITLEAMDRVVVSVAGGYCPASNQVVFSPLPEGGHLTAIAKAFDRADQTIDIAIYSLDDGEIETALTYAVARGITVRMLYDGVRRSISNETASFLAEQGVDVRWVDAILHHKFAVIDGPRNDLSEAESALIIGGSANWTLGAMTQYDENSVFITGDATHAMAFQREFELLWENSRPLSDQQPERVQGLPLPVTDGAADDSSIEAVFTSSNYLPVETDDGPDLQWIEDSKVVQDRLVDLIQSARRSVAIASGHFRLRDIALALIELHASLPEVDIRVYLDQLELASDEDVQEHMADWNTCMTDAGADPTAQAACGDLSFYYAYLVEQAGIPVRYKTYAWDWDINSADLMHHKYFIIDGEQLATGSYNLSNTSETESLENMIIYPANSYPDLIDAFRANFDAIWDTGRPEQRYERFLEGLSGSSPSVPLVWAPMALTRSEYITLLDDILRACPDADSDWAQNSAVCYR